MNWSPQQEVALRDFSHWWKNRGSEQVYYLFGFAGSGKSTLARTLAEDISGTVLYGAFTGKAAAVMRRKGCPGATTLHSLLYNVKQGSQRELVELEVKIKALRDAEPVDQAALAQLIARRAELVKTVGAPRWSVNPDSPLKSATLLVVDEVSMVDARLGEDILSFGKPVLVLGDPAQLPPVKGAGFFMTDRPNTMLTEVHRTALDNPVLALATRVRNRESLALGDYGESRIVPRASLAGGETLEYDQILVGRNDTRRAANAAMRRRLGYAGTWPLPEEKLVCLRNNHELGLLNGTLWTVRSATSGEDCVDLTVESENGATVETVAFSEPFLGREAPRWSHGLDEFDYGYALTTHKAQGSEWPGVYIVDESSVFRADAHRWLYTALTRASERVLVVR